MKLIKTEHNGKYDISLCLEEFDREFEAIACLHQLQSMNTSHVRLLLIGMIADAKI